MLDILADYVNVDESDDLYRAVALHVLSQNLVHGDALTMRTSDRPSDHLCRVGLSRQGQVPAARLSVLTFSPVQMSTFGVEGSLFAHLGKHEIFTPDKTYPPMTVGELACSGSRKCSGRKAV